MRWTRRYKRCAGVAAAVLGGVAGPEAPIFPGSVAWGQTQPPPASEDDPAAAGEAAASEPPAPGEDSPLGQPYEDRIIRSVDIAGLRRVARDLVENNINTAVGDPYSPTTVEQDVRNLTRLNQFRLILPEVKPTADGGVAVTYILEEWPLAADVQVAGNRVVSDQDIFDAILIRPGDPLDTFQINRAREAIVELYQTRGFYLAQVETDADELTESNIVLFRVREGPRVKIRDIEFRGNEAVDDDRLRRNLKTKTSLFLLRTGQLDEDALATDIAALTDYYKDRGYLDARVERQLDLSNDLKEAKIVFLVEEGRLYTMRSVRVEGATRLLPEQISGLMSIKAGDVYSKDKIEKSRRAIEDALGRLGYYDASVTATPLRDPDAGWVDLLLEVHEGQPQYVGEVKVQGNRQTKDEVVRRELRHIRPNRPLSKPAVEEAKRALQSLNIFEGEPEITPVDPETGEEPALGSDGTIGPSFRDIIVEVQEGNTGDLSFGAAVSSDLGLFGTIGFEQRNFDVTDTPDSFEEFIKGRAFRGAGQTFSIQLQPGDEFTNFSVSLLEPYLFGTDSAMRASLGYTDRELESWDETRAGGTLRLSRRLGEVWTGFVSTRLQSVDLRDIDADAPTDVFDVEGQNTVSALGFGVIRSTLDNRFRPTRGTRVELGYEQIGAIGGDFTFSRVDAEHIVYFPISEDFLGRVSTLMFNTRIGYQFGGDTPVYERYYLGGRSLRGFDYRTVSPKGIRNDNGQPSDDPVGGDWLFFWGTQYEFPLFDKYIGGVVFLDTGTVTEDPGFSDYRVGAGTGLRLYIPQLGQAPLAFDFGFPLASEDDDDEQIFSFSIQVPF